MFLLLNLPESSEPKLVKSSRFLAFWLLWPEPFITAKALFEPLANDEFVDEAFEEAVDADEAARCTVDDDEVLESDDLGRKRVLGQYGSTIEYTENKKKKN